MAANKTERPKVVSIHTKAPLGLSGAQGGGGGGGDMLEKRVAQLEIDIAEIKATLFHLATKAAVADVRTEVEKMGRLIVMWNVGTVVAVAAVVFAIIRLLN